MNYDLPSLDVIEGRSDVQIRFTVGHAGSSTSFRFDNIPLTADAVPEPASLTFLVTGYGSSRTPQEASLICHPGGPVLRSTSRRPATIPAHARGKGALHDMKHTRPGGRIQLYFQRLRN
jgi:hypothetical protein